MGFMEDKISQMINVKKARLMMKYKIINTYKVPSN